MATVNTIKTRILNKYDLLANYTSSFVPLKGEICLVEIPSGSTSSGLTPPAVGIKVGDGSTTFDKLQWVQAIAGDVSSFVKTINSSDDFAKEVGIAVGYTGKTNIKELIDGINTKFTNYSTTAQMNTALGKKVDTTTLTAYQAEVTQLLAGKVDNGTFTSYQSEVSTALGKKVETSVADSAASSSNKLLAKTAIEKLIKDNASDPINTKIGNLTDLTTTDKDSIVEAINEINAEADANAAAIENLQKAVGTDANGLATKISTLEGEMDEVQGTLTGYTSSKTVAAAVADAKAAGTTAQTQIGIIANLNNKKTTLVEEINTVDGRVTTTVGNLETLSGKVTTLIGDDANKSVRTIANEELAAQLLDGATNGAEDNFKTLKQLADWLEQHPEDAAAMNTEISNLKKLHASGKTVAQEVADGITGANLSQYATDADLAGYKTEVSETYATKVSVADTITAAASAVQSGSFAGTAMTKSGTALSISKDAARAALGYGTMADKSASDYSTTTQMNNAISAAKTELKGGTSDTSSSATIAGAKKYADEKVTGLNTTLSASIKANTDAIAGMDYSAADNSGAMFGITQVNGKITGTTRRKIKNADLDTSDVFVFYCGNATGYDANMATVTIE